MKFITVAFIAMFAATICYAQETTNKNLIQNFQNPPHLAKARTWWHWMNGNVSKKGITADLEAMKRVGIQEAQIFNVKLSLPKG